MRIYKTEEWIEKGSHVHVFASGKRTAEEPTHLHDFIEIVYILSGNGVEEINGQLYEVKHGDMLFIHYGSTHSFSFDGEFSYVNICFSPENVEQSLLTPDNAFALLSLASLDELRGDALGGKISFDGAARREIESILYAMLREYGDKETGWNGVVENYLNILLTKMLRKSRLGVQSGTEGDVWDGLLAYIDANLDQKLTLAALAGQCFYNPSYFSRIFKEKFGMSPVEFIHRKRLGLATELLSQSILSVDEISARAGFSDRSAFYHVFAKYVGGTPTEYRKRALQQSKRLAKQENTEKK